MRSEAQYCTCIVKSLNSIGDLAYKIPDASGNWATSIRVFDIMGRKDNKPLYLEAKFNKDPSAFNLNRIEDHQAYYLVLNNFDFLFPHYEILFLHFLQEKNLMPHKF